MKFGILALFVLSPALVPAQNEVTVRGRIVNEFGLGVVGADVVLMKTLSKSAPDADGAFAIPHVREGRYMLVVALAGYEGMAKDIVLPEDSEVGTLAIRSYSQWFFGDPKDAVRDLEDGIVQLYYRSQFDIPQTSLDSLTQRYGFEYRCTTAFWPAYTSGYNFVVDKYLESLHGKDWIGIRQGLDLKLSDAVWKMSGKKPKKPKKGKSLR